MDELDQMFEKLKKCLMFLVSYVFDPCSPHCSLLETDAGRVRNSFVNSRPSIGLTTSCSCFSSPDRHINQGPVNVLKSVIERLEALKKFLVRSTKHDHRVFS